MIGLSMRSAALNCRQLVGLVAKNSPDFFDRSQKLIAAGRCVVPLRTVDDTYRIAATGLTEIIVPEDGFGWTTQTVALPSGDKLAQINFTSGTQGEPKGVLLTCDNLLNTVGRLRDALRLDDAARFYVGTPIYHSFGGGCCRAVAAAGGNIYLPRKGFNSHEILTLLKQGEINGIAAVPTMWRILLKQSELFRDYGAFLRWVLIGSQPMSREEKLALRRLFPNARIIHHYGLTEASSSVVLDVTNSPDEFLESVGIPTPGVEVQITESGRIAIRGAHVAKERLVGGALVSNVDCDGWFVTSDAGEVRDGHLFFLGRVDDLINAGGLKVSADAIEEAIIASLDIPRQISVVRIPDRDRGDGVLLAVTLGCARSDREILASAVSVLRESGLDAASALRIMRVPDLPRTENDKVQRVALAKRFAEQSALPAAGVAPAALPVRKGLGSLQFSRIAPLRSKFLPGGDARALRTIFEEIFPGVEISDNDSFVSLGGDSLSFVALSIAIEGRLGHLPDDWQNRSIAELRTVKPKTSCFRRIDTTLFLRFVGIISIVYSHFMSSGLGGSTYLLMVAVGYNFSRFQLTNVLSRDSVSPVFVSALRTALPLLLLLSLIEMRKGELEPLTVLLLGNFVPAAARTLDFWFVEVIIQIMFILGAMLAIPSLRRVARSHPLMFAQGLLVVSVAVAMLGPLVWDTTPYFDRMPHMVLWLFALGMVLDAGHTTAQRLFNASLVMLLPLLIWGIENNPFWIYFGPAWIWIGGMLLVLFKDIPLPTGVSRIAYYVGGASMFIYITHYTVWGLWQKVSPSSPNIVGVVIAIVAGVLIWLAWEAIVRWLRRYSSSLSTRWPSNTVHLAAAQVREGLSQPAEVNAAQGCNVENENKASSVAM